MPFFSTNNSSLRVSLKHAVLASLTADKGLFMPTSVPVLPQSFFSELSTLTLQEIAFEVSIRLFGEAVSKQVLRSIIDESITFPAPLVSLTSCIASLELFHGPTCAFKDFGARFMAGLVSHFIQEGKKRLLVIVATSGDTGGAVANAFLNRPLVDVIILYPKGLVSEIQEQQFTTLGGNIHCFQIEGSFDSCQALAKEALVDAQLTQLAESKGATLTSANSMNIARLVPQSFYFFSAAGILQQKGFDLHSPLIFSVPSGNFGNLTAGILAARMGLPIHRLIAATNVNKAVPDYLATGTYTPRPSISTVSNAMDVGAPNNFPRMLSFFDNAHEQMKEFIVGASYTDEETTTTIKEVFSKYNYVLDPHGAIGFRGLDDNLHKFPGAQGIFLHTAHPAKFPDAVRPIVGEALTSPPALLNLEEKTKKFVPLPPEYPEFRNQVRLLIDP